MSEKILGLELTASGLEAVVINKSFKICTLIDECWIPHDNIVRDNVAGVFLGQWDTHYFDNALSIIISKLDLKRCSRSALCLPASLISFRTIKVPFTSDTKIRQILPFELTPHLPLNHANYMSDFLLVNKSKISNGNILNGNNEYQNPNEHQNINECQDNHIFTASLPVDIIDKCFAVLKKYGIEPEIITSQGVVAAIALEQDAVWVEKRESDTVISIFFKKSVMAVRTFACKKDNSFIEKTIHQTLIGLHQRYNIKIAPRVCYLEDEIIQDEIFKNNVFQGKINSHQFNAVASALCCAKRKKIINFCQGHYAKDSFFHKFKEHLFLPAIFITITFITIFLSIHYDIFLLEKEVKTLDKAIVQILKRTFPDVKAVVEPLMQMQVKLKEAEKQSDFMPRKLGGSDYIPIRIIDILYELSKLIPDNIDVDITRFLFSEGRVVIAGSTDNFNTVDKIKTLIEKYKRFKSVTISSATADKNESRVIFNFIIELQGNN